MTSDLQQWYAIRVRSRCEKLASAELTRRGFEVFAAIAPQRRVWADRVRVVDMPLFAGYIFSRFDIAAARHAVERAPGVAGIVRFGSVDVPVDAGEMESVRLVAGSGLAVMRPPQLRVGSMVRVIAGPLKGAEGWMTAWKSGHQLTVSVSILQRAVSVEIDEALVEPVGGRSAMWREAGAA